MKQEIVQERGDTLIVVPCWWDGSSGSLIATIKQKRPELFSELQCSFSPISQEPPEGYFASERVPGVGELMQPSFVSFLQTEPLQWWLSEKYDGIRACWRVMLYTRVGREINVPNSISKSFPNNVVDGEIWFGRGQYPEARRLVSVGNSKITNSDSNWSNFRFVAFDCPNPRNSSLPFETRYETLSKFLPFDHPFILMEACSKNKSDASVGHFTNEILKGGGDGLIMRKCQSTYEHGRSLNSLKIKAHGNNEALVKQVEDDNVFLLQSPAGELIKAKLAANWWDYTPKSGDVVSYYVASAPARNYITKIRNDVVWDYVIENANNSQEPQSMAISRISSKALHQPTSDQQVRGFWTENDNVNMISFFNSFARSRNLDPLLPSSWYPLKNSDILAAGGSSILIHYGNSFAKALIDLYPNIGLDSSKFTSVPQNYWDNEKHRKAFLDQFMKSRNLDPLLPIDWYSISNESLIATKGGLSVLNHYGGSLFQTLRHLFPSLDIEEKCFYKINQKYWQSISNRKQVLIELAKKKGVKVYHPQSWYSITTSDVISEQGGPAVLFQYGGSLSKTLTSLFPDFNLDPLKIDSTSMADQVATNRRKQFLISFSIKHNFDPLIAENWYPITPSLIQEEKGGKALLYFYKELPAAVQHQFPNIGVKKEMFKVKQRIK